MKKVITFCIIGILISHSLFTLAEEILELPNEVLLFSNEKEVANKTTGQYLDQQLEILSWNLKENRSWNRETFKNTGIILSWDLESTWETLLIDKEKLISQNPNISEKRSPIEENPTLIVTEAFLHKTNNWIEISNISSIPYSWTIQLDGIGKDNKTYTYPLIIPAKTSLILAEKDNCFTGNLLKKIVKDKYFINRKSWLNLILSYWSGQKDKLMVHPEWTKFLKDKDSSFEKVFIDGEWLTTRTSPDRRKNINWSSELPLIANPGIYFTEAENAKDISQSKNLPESEKHPDIPISCSEFNDRYRLEIQEIFQGNNSYQPFIELKWTDTPNNYQTIKLTGNILEKEIIIEKSDLRDKNKSFIIGKDEFRHNKGIDSEYHFDFNLLNQTWYLIVEWFNWQQRQVLDSILLTSIGSGKSSYFKGNKSDCINIFDEISDFSPWFDKKFLEFFQIDSEPKIEYIKIWWGGSCSCPSKEDLCPTKKDNKTENNEESKIEDEYEEEQKSNQNLTIEKYQVKIEDINYDPEGSDKDKESITLILTEGDNLDLNLLTLNINGKKKKIKGTLKQGDSQTFIGNFGFPNTSKVNNTILVQLKYKDTVLDSYYYTITTKEKEKKEKIQKEGIKVFSVIDGDTIKYRDENWKLQSVRLLWIDAPESNTVRYKKTECYGKEAKDYLTERLKGQYIQISFDNEQTTDRYGRLLAYVSLDGQLINEELIAKGFAKEYTYKQNYQKQELFKKAEEKAKADQRGMRNPKYCPNLLKEEEDIKQSIENLIIKIKAIDYNPEGSDKNNESITLSIFNKSWSGNFIDFNNQFWLFIFENQGSGLDLQFEDFEKNGKFKDLSFLGKQEITNPLIIKWDFWLPNTKSNCIALVQKEYLFDIACYEIKNIKKKTEEVPLLTGIKLKIHSITPNPKGKDSWKEKIEISFSSENKENKQLFLSSGFYLLINGKSKKTLSGYLENWIPKIFKGNFNFPNTNSCIEIKYWNQTFDNFCYGKTKDWITYTSTNQILTDFEKEELALIKAVKLVKERKKICIKYRNHTFSCRNIPNSRSQQEKQRKTKSKIWESAFLGIENLLKSEYRPRYEESKVKNYFQLSKQMKSDIKKNIFSTTIGNTTYEWKDFSKIFEKKENLSFWEEIGIFIQGLLSDKFYKLYEKKKQQRINTFSDSF